MSRKAVSEDEDKVVSVAGRPVMLHPSFRPNDLLKRLRVEPEIEKLRRESSLSAIAEFDDWISSELEP